MPFLGSIVAAVGAVVKGTGIVVCLVPGGQLIGAGMIVGGHTVMVTGAILMLTPT